MTHTVRRALITGASSGLGELLARRLAERGSDLVVVARREDRLHTLAADLRDRHGVEVQVVAADLAQPGAAASILAAAGSGNPIALDLVFNNAGFGMSGRFDRADPAELDRMVALNVGALTALARAVLPPMLTRGSGLLVNVASTAAFQPIPGGAVYAASKAYVLALSQALWQETRGTGVRVTALCPGPTDTEFFDVAGGDFKIGNVTTPAQVVDALLTAVDRGPLPPSLVPDLPNRVLSQVSRVLPRRVVLPVVARMAKLARHRD